LVIFFTRTVLLPLDPPKALYLILVEYSRESHIFVGLSNPEQKELDFSALMVAADFNASHYYQEGRNPQPPERLSYDIYFIENARLYLNQVEFERCRKFGQAIELLTWNCRVLLTSYR
jgi:hypothetical protein